MNTTEILYSVYVSINGQTTKYELTKPEIIKLCAEQNLKGVIAKQDWRMTWTEYVEVNDLFFSKLNSLIIHLEQTKKNIADLKSYNT